MDLATLTTTFLDASRRYIAFEDNLTQPRERVTRRLACLRAGDALEAAGLTLDEVDALFESVR